MDLQLPGYQQYFLGAVKKGYSGTAVLTRLSPREVTYGIGIEEHDQEGRVITCFFDRFTLVNCYTPNAQNGLKRLDYRMRWEDDFRAYLTRLDAQSPVVLCGDLNVAHQEIDLKNPRTNHMNAGFSDQEREKFSALLEAGFIDSFRYYYRTSPAPIVGGAICATLGPPTRDGALIISWCPASWRAVCAPPRSIRKSMAPTIARWSCKWSCSQGIGIFEKR